MTFDRRLALIYVLTAGLCFVLGVGYALQIPSQYTTDALLIPKEQNGNAQTSSLAAATRLLGLGVGGDQSSNFSKFQKYWGSRDIAEAILERQPELARILLSTNWDAANNRWYDRPHTLRQYAAVPLNWLFGVYPTIGAPTAQDLATYIKNSMTLEADPSGAQLQISYSYSDPAFAQRFLTMVIAETDKAVRDSEQKRYQDFINYSRNRLQQESNVGYREALTSSVQQFEISDMYSRAGQNFSFQYVETPYIPINRSAPRPLTYAILAFIVANLAAACLVAALMLWPYTGPAPRILAMANWLLRRLPFTGKQHQRPA